MIKMRVKLNRVGDIQPDEPLSDNQLLAQRVQQILALNRGSAFFDRNRGLNHEAILAKLLTRDQILGSALREIQKIDGAYVVSSGITDVGKELILNFGVREIADN